jgi:hypothetical protein
MLVQPADHRAEVAARLLGRDCGSCSLCCKVYDVPPIDNKPQGVWCKHCKPGRGCGIWQERPQFCRDYHCQWFFIPSLGPEWRPDVAKFVINLSPDEFWYEIVTDSSNPHAWRREPYGSKIRAVAGIRMTEGKGVMLHLHDKRFIITPTEELDIGSFPPDAKFGFRVSISSGQTTYHVDVHGT